MEGREKAGERRFPGAKMGRERKGQLYRGSKVAIRDSGTLEFVESSKIGYSIQIDL